MVTKLESELIALTERLRFGGTQAECEALRRRITGLREAIAERERNIAFVHDSFVDDDEQGEGKRHDRQH